MKYKGCYVARVIIFAEHEVGSDTRPFEEVKYAFENELTGELKSLLDANLDDAEVEIQQIKAYLCQEDS